MLSGGQLYLTLIVLAMWLALLCRTAWKSVRTHRSDRRRTFRTQLTIGGIALSAIAVGSLFLLHLSWISPSISQRLGGTAIRILSLLLFFATLLGFVLSAAGSGRIRLIGIGTSVVTGLWWFFLATAAAISMGVPIARHPTRFLIPEGYVGWVEVKYADPKSPALPLNGGMLVCRIPERGLLITSSQLEEGWAKDQYFYYSADGSIRALKDTGWGGGGMIWGGENSTTGQYFYVGTEEQYHHAVSRNERRPFDETKNGKGVPQGP